MDLDDGVLQLLGLSTLKNPQPSGGYVQRSYRQELLPKKPTAERIKMRQAEQERRRREALAANIDMNKQSDIMTEFEKSLREEMRSTGERSNGNDKQLAHHKEPVGLAAKTGSLNVHYKHIDKREERKPIYNENKSYF